MLIVMATQTQPINALLEDSLNEPEIGITDRFRWHATPRGNCGFVE